jgi:uncharacterized MnhB-related membrane protein
MSGAAHWLGLSFDSILAVLMIAVAWRALSARDGFESVALFITFGVMASIAWVRIGSPDLALAEAAIGTGVAGALFVASLAVLERSETRAEEPPDDGEEKDEAGEGASRGTDASEEARGEDDADCE